MNKKRNSTTLRVLTCISNKDYETKTVEQIIAAGFKKTHDSDENTMTFESDLDPDVTEVIEEILCKEGVPFSIHFAMPTDGLPYIYVFDGVRPNKVLSDPEGNTYVDMRVLRSLIDMLEEDLEIRALLYSNEHWINTDVSTMFKNGMENTKKIGGQGETLETKTIGSD